LKNKELVKMKEEMRVLMRKNKK